MSTEEKSILIPIKEIELEGGFGDGQRLHIKPSKTSLTLKGESRRLFYEYDRTKKDGSGIEVFKFAKEEAV